MEPIAAEQTLRLPLTIFLYSTGCLYSTPAGFQSRSPRGSPQQEILSFLALLVDRHTAEDAASQSLPVNSMSATSSSRRCNLPSDRRRALLCLSPCSCVDFICFLLVFWGQGLHMAQADPGPELLLSLPLERLDLQDMPPQLHKRQTSVTQPCRTHKTHLYWTH